MKIHPAPLVSSKKELIRQIKAIETYTDEVDIDIVDWKYTENKTVDIDTVLSLDTTLKFNFDLMVDEPVQYMDKLFADDRVQTIIFNLRAKEDFENKIFDYCGIGKKIGISINPENSVSEIAEYLEILDVVEIYTIEPGAQGQPFLPQRLELSNELVDIGFRGEIYVDGGMNDNTIQLVKHYPVDVISVGSFLSNAEDPKENFRKLIKMLSM